MSEETEFAVGEKRGGGRTSTVGFVMAESEDEAREKANERFGGPIVVTPNE